MDKSLTKREILEALKCDPESGMCGWIGEFSGTKSDNNNLGGVVTANMVMKLEETGLIEYIMGDNIWVIKAEYNKVN